jgi:hypothetical protein
MSSKVKQILSVLPVRGETSSSLVSKEESLIAQFNGLSPRQLARVLDESSDISRGYTTLLISALAASPDKIRVFLEWCDRRGDVSLSGRDVSRVARAMGGATEQERTLLLTLACTEFLVNFITRDMRTYSYVEWLRPRTVDVDLLVKLLRERSPSWLKSCNGMRAKALLERLGGDDGEYAKALVHKVPGLAWQVDKHCLAVESVEFMGEIKEALVATGVNPELATTLFDDHRDDAADQVISLDELCAVLRVLKAVN